MEEIKQELEEKWDRAVEQRRKMGPVRLMHQQGDMKKSKAELIKLFPLDKPQNVLVFTDEFEPWLTLGAEEMEPRWYTMANPNPLSLLPGPSESHVWTIIGTSAEICEDKIDALRSEGKKEAKALRKRYKQEQRALKAAKAVEPEKKVEAAAEVSQNSGEWDVTGEYQLSSDDMEIAYMTTGEMTMKLFRTENARTQTAQMFAQLEMGLLGGWFYFETNEGKQGAASSPSGARKRKNGAAPDASRKRRLRRGWIGDEDFDWLVNILDG
jgi:hypothetical protein